MKFFRSLKIIQVDVKSFGGNFKMFRSLKLKKSKYGQKGTTPKLTPFSLARRHVIFGVAHKIILFFLFLFVQIFVGFQSLEKDNSNFESEFVRSL